MAKEKFTNWIKIAFRISSFALLLVAFIGQVGFNFSFQAFATFLFLASVLLITEGNLNLINKGKLTFKNIIHTTSVGLGFVGVFLAIALWSNVPLPVSLVNISTAVIGLWNILEMFVKD